MESGHLGVLNVGVTRYSLPLGPTEAKKLAHLAALADWHVVGLSASPRFRRAHEPVELYLLPLWPLAPLRFLLVLGGALAVGLRLVGAKKLDVVVSQSPYEGIVGPLLRTWGRLLGRRVAVVTEIHGDWVEAPFLYERIPLASVVRPILSAWARFVLRRSDRIRTISRFLEARVREAAPGVPLESFPTYTDFELFRSASPRSGSDGPVLAIGGLYPVKGFSYLLQAMRDVVAARPETELWIAGDGPLREALEREAASLGIGGRVHFLGPLAPDDLRERYREARMLVLPSLSEGLGRVVWEAMASGLPVVASNVGGIPDLVADGETGFLVPPKDAEALADRILWLYRHPDRADAMGARGRETVERRFSTERYVEGYRALLETARATS